MGQLATRTLSSRCVLRGARGKQTSSVERCVPIVRCWRGVLAGVPVPEELRRWDVRVGVVGRWWQ